MQGRLGGVVPIRVGGISKGSSDVVFQMLNGFNHRVNSGTGCVQSAEAEDDGNVGNAIKAALGIIGHHNGFEAFGIDAIVGGNCIHADFNSPVAYKGPADN